MELCLQTPWKRLLRVRSDGEKIVESDFVALSHPLHRSSDPLLREAADQLRAYFRGAMRRFDLPLLLRGTALQCDAWACVAELAVAEFVSYADVARAIARPAAHRGVAAAMSVTPLDLFIPAHRVVGSDGRVRGTLPGSLRATLVAFERATVSKKLREAIVLPRR